MNGLMERAVMADRSRSDANAGSAQEYEAYEMSWHSQGQPILSFLPICHPVMPQATIVDSSHYRQNRRTQQDEEEPGGTPPLTSQAFLQAFWYRIG